MSAEQSKSRINSKLDPTKVDEVVDFLQARKGDQVSMRDVMSLAELMVGSFRSFFDALDSSVYRELKDIADYISTAREEIRGLQANDIKSHRIPAAGLELDAIVKATEDATNTIMEQAERLMALEGDDLESYQAEVNKAAIQLFEACSFQDLTGQRISKVVQVLNYIEARIERFAEVIGEKDAEPVLSDEEAKAEKRRGDLLLNGPQLDGAGASQSDIDAMLGDFDNIEPNGPEREIGNTEAMAAEPDEAISVDIDALIGGELDADEAVSACATAATGLDAENPIAQVKTEPEIESSDTVDMEDSEEIDIDALFDGGSIAIAPAENGAQKAAKPAPEAAAAKPEQPQPAKQNDPVDEQTREPASQEDIDALFD